MSANIGREATRPSEALKNRTTVKYSPSLSLSLYIYIYIYKWRGCVIEKLMSGKDVKRSLEVNSSE